MAAQIKRIGMVGGVVLLCVAVLFMGIYKIADHAMTNLTSQIRRPLVVIDAGHGGFDGGASSADGTLEKDINLAIAKRVAMWLPLCGFRVQMTRVDDTALCEDDSAPIRQKKVSDMKARLALYEEADLNISIHQNFFGAPTYHGTQLFYSATHPCSKLLAAAVREETVRLLQPDNTRELKSGNRDIYLLYKTTKPTVLVECGFLSNREECAKLCSDDYQQALGFAIACGIVRYAAQDTPVIIGKE